MNSDKRSTLSLREISSGSSKLRLEEEIREIGCRGVAYFKSENYHPLRGGMTSL